MTKYGDDQEISNSEMQAFQDCGRRWWLSYYRSLRPIEEAPVGPLSVGSRIHNALEYGYSTPGRGEAALKILAESIDADAPLAIDLGPDIEKQFWSEAELCTIMLEGFIEWAAEEGLDAGWEVLAHEQIVKAPPIQIGETNVILKGKLDQMVKREMDGSVWMRDWKTTQTMKPVMMQFGPQLKMYLLLLQLSEVEAKVSGGQFVFIKKVKRTARANPPFYSIEPFHISSVEMDSFWNSTLGILRRMIDANAALDRGEDHQSIVPARPTRDCSWRCPFYSVCPMFDDGSHVEAYLEANYKVSDPYEYYGIDESTKELE